MNRQWTIRQTDLHVANQVQVSNLDESLQSAKFWKEMADTYPRGGDAKVYNARAYAFLARACELEQGLTIERRDLGALLALHEADIDYRNSGDDYH